jgi:hypothetical protein
MSDESQETENVKGERTRPRIPYYARILTMKFKNIEVL